MEGIIPCQATEKRSIRKKNDRRGKTPIENLLFTLCLLHASFGRLLRKTEGISPST